MFCKLYCTEIMVLQNKFSETADFQDTTDRCLIDEKLFLIYRPSFFNGSSVKVVRINGREIGWLPKEIAREIIPFIIKGYKVETKISKITIGNFFIKNDFRCVIEIIVKLNNIYKILGIKKEGD